MRGFFKEYLDGTAPLWKSFWLLWLGGISALTLIAITGFTLSLKYLHGGITWYGVGPAFLLLLTAYSFFCWISVWRCSQNSTWRGWRFISKAVVITVMGAYLFASYSVFNLYNNKPAVTADELSELAKDAKFALSYINNENATMDDHKRFLSIFYKIYMDDLMSVSPATNSVYGEVYRKVNQFALEGSKDYLKALMMAYLGPYGNTAEGGEWLNEMLWQNLETKPMLTVETLTTLVEDARRELIERVYVRPIHDGFSFQKIMERLDKQQIPSGIKGDLKQITDNLRVLAQRLTGKTTEGTASVAIQIGWVGLWNSEMIGWAENVNRISRICPDSMPELDKKRCLEAGLGVRTWTIPVHEEPSFQSRLIGNILIYVKPGESFKLAYKSGDSNNEIPFQPDVFDPDWGYGPYLHQTFQAENSGWFLLPKDPLGEPGWINAGKLADNNKISVLTVKEGGIYVMENVNIVIEKIDPDKIFFRPEQAGDMWCETGEAPELKKVTPSSMLIKKIYDANGHLKLKPAYTRGC